MRFSEAERIFRIRHDETRKCIQKASGGLIWAGKEGILVIAPNRSVHEDRIHQLHDRIVCLMRGTVNAVAQLWMPAVSLVCQISFELSAGDVYAKDIAKQASNTLIKHKFDFNSEQLRAEMTLAQITAKGNGQDYLGHIDFEGEIKEFEHFRFFDVSDEDEDRAKLNLAETENNLAQLYNYEMPLKEVMDMFLKYSDSPPDSVVHHIGNVLFSDPDAKRVETVILNREMVEKKDYGKVFKRL